MKTLFQTPISEIENPEVIEVIDDFCQMLNWRKDDYLDYNLREFLEVVFKENPKSISLSHIPLSRILDRKMGKLRDHGIYPVCRMLNNEDTMEQHAKISLLAFLKERFATPPTQPKARRIATGHDSVTRTIIQRRLNGDL